MSYYKFVADYFRTKKLCSRLSSTEVRFYTEIGRFAFLISLLEDLGATYDDHLKLIGKRVVDFLLMLIELFSLGVTAEALRGNIGSKSAISLQRGPVDPTFQVNGVAPLPLRSVLLCSDRKSKIRLCLTAGTCLSGTRDMAQSGAASSAPGSRLCWSTSSLSLSAFQTS